MQLVSLASGDTVLYVLQVLYADMGIVSNSMAAVHA